MAEGRDAAGLWIPAIRGLQGGRQTFLTAMRMPEFTEQVPVLTDTPKRELKEQRIYDSKHAAAIASYLLSVDDYVLPPLIVTLDQAPIFQPIDGDSPFGMLQLPPGTKRRITDGMHRGEGIAQATTSDTEGKLQADLIGIWFVVEGDIEKRRSMFADVNRNQKAVPKSLAIAYDSRDPYAIALRTLVGSHPLLKGVVEQDRSRATRGSGKLYTMAALRDALESFAGRGLSDEAQIMEHGRLLFDCIRKARPELSGLEDDPTSIDELRKRSIVGSSTTLRVIAGALRIGIDRGVELEELSEALARVSFAPSAPVWVEAGFVTPGSTTPSSRNQEVRAATLALADAISLKVEGKT